MLIEWYNPTTGKKIDTRDEPNGISTIPEDAMENKRLLVSHVVVTSTYIFFRHQREDLLTLYGRIQLALD